MDRTPRRTVPGYRQEDGQYVKLKPDTDVSIDGLLKEGLGTVQIAMSTIRANISAGMVDRENIQNLKDCMTMLSDLKKKEKDLLDELSDEELAKLSK